VTPNSPSYPKSSFRAQLKHKLIKQMMTEELKKPELVPVRFNFVRLSFTPYNHASQHNSKQIVERVANHLSVESKAGKGILIDKHEGRKNELRRPLFVTNAVFMLKEHRIKLSMALLRTGKVPMVRPAEKFMVLPLSQYDGEIAEVTHVFIDYSTPVVVMCVEFNPNGPRVSDLEYYFRIIARDKLSLAKATVMEYFMESNLDKAMSDLKEVLNFDIKMQPQKINQLDLVSQGYIGGMGNMAQSLKPTFLSVKAHFQLPGKSQKSEINSTAVNAVKHFFNQFKKDPKTSDLFEGFTVSYKDSAGSDHLFDLLKGKKEFYVECDPNEQSDRKWYDLISKYFDSFMATLQ
jgi:hypothetical protein